MHPPPQAATLSGLCTVILLSPLMSFLRMQLFDKWMSKECYRCVPIRPAPTQASTSRLTLYLDFPRLQPLPALQILPGYCLATACPAPVHSGRPRLLRFESLNERRREACFPRPSPADSPPLASRNRNRRRAFSGRHFPDQLDDCPSILSQKI